MNHGNKNKKEVITMKFKVGQTVKIIKAYPTSSPDAHKHLGEIVTIKECIPWCGCYEVEEITDILFTANCFIEIKTPQKQSAL